MRDHNITARAVRLPNTCPENRRQFTHCKLLTAVHPESWNAAGFEGTLFETGSRIKQELLREKPVLLEFCGPQGAWKRRPRENLWILWRYDQESQDWREIARALAFARLSF